jgi:Tol biopolymer transport system component
MRNLALLGATLLALSACAENDSPLGPGDSPESTPSLATGTLPGTILFGGRGADGLDDVFSVKPDGGGLLHLTSFPGYEIYPTWSWDNQLIVMLRARPDGSNVTHFEPFVVDKNGNNGHWVTSSPLGVDVEDPSWSPDGTRILASTDDFELIGFDVAAGTAKPLGVHGESASFDKTGTLIIYSNPGTISIINAATLAPMRTILAPSGNLVRHPAFSPDGKRIAFTAGPGGLGDIWVSNADGTGMARLVGGPSTDVRPTWSPDGLTIAYTSTRRGDAEVWRISTSGGKRTQVTTGFGVTPSWSH